MIKSNDFSRINRINKQDFNNGGLKTIDFKKTTVLKTSIYNNIQIKK